MNDTAPSLRLLPKAGQSRAWWRLPASPSALAWTLAGGDAHALLAAFPAGTPLPDGFRRIGLVEPAGELPVLVAGQRWSGETGHEHFRR